MQRAAQVMELKTQRRRVDELFHLTEVLARGVKVPFANGKARQQRMAKSQLAA